VLVLSGLAQAWRVVDTSGSGSETSRCRQKPPRSSGSDLQHTQYAHATVRRVWAITVRQSQSSRRLHAYTSAHRRVDECSGRCVQHAPTTQRTRGVSVSRVHDCSGEMRALFEPWVVQRRVRRIEPVVPHTVRTPIQ
jgi:hypothetical protein